MRAQNSAYTSSSTLFMLSLMSWILLSRCCIRRSISLIFGPIRSNSRVKFSSFLSYSFKLFFSASRSC
uniref:Putative secreted peptide n=1 Tax=Anopheles braziliensis TaxID=58242 RepID=A0A2M3ZSM8_9DIPT